MYNRKIIFYCNCYSDSLHTSNYSKFRRI